MFNLAWGAATGFTIAGCVLGALAWDAWLRRRERRKRQLPNRWPLDSRRLVTQEEHEVWLWLKGAFYDHQVMVKTPLARFTTPRHKQDRKPSFQMLNGVYCTFTVATANGTVVGCLDVPGKAGLLRSHRDMKESILTGCGIAYAVVRGNNLPALEVMRAAFLGELEEPQEAAQEPVDEFAQEVAGFARAVSDTAVKEAPAASTATLSLKSKLEFARRKRDDTFNPLITRTGIVEDPAGGNPQRNMRPWEDSFFAADSRPPPLK
jgi:hypothetical protein